MTQNKRIALNVIATYGRSLYRLICGLFSARWVLMALGEVDYGLIGLIGGMIVMLSFLNDVLAGAVSRFYAYSVGSVRLSTCEDKDECARWFNTALSIHVCVPLILIVCGYPVGAWAIHDVLTIPSARIDACVWIWRLVCLSGFSTMITVPFRAMYTAKQEIAELTLYSFATTTLNVMVLYFMVTHSGDWLIPYSVWMCIEVVLPQVIIAIRACCIYPECRFVPGFMFDARRVKDVLRFAGCRLFCSFSMMCSQQGVSLLVNKCLGPVRNAAMSIGNGMAGHCMTLSGAFVGALSPAITTAAGCGDAEKMKRLAYRACVLSTLSVIIFAIPLMIEIDEVMRLWLKSPPAWSASICCCILAGAIIERMAEGHWISIFAVDRFIGQFQMAEALCWLSTIFVAYGLIVCGLDVIGACLALVIAKSAAVVVKVVYGRKSCGLSVRYWCRNILLPITFVAFISLLVGSIPKVFMATSFIRICVTTILSESAIIPLSWFLILSSADRQFMIQRIKHLISN